MVRLVRAFWRLVSVCVYWPCVGNRAKVGQNHDALKPVSATLSVLKWSGAIFRPRSSTPSVRSFCLCTYHWKLSSSWVSIESSGLENIPRIPANRAKDAQNQDASKAARLLFHSENEVGPYFGSTSLTPSVRSLARVPLLIHSLQYLPLSGQLFSSF